MASSGTNMLLNLSATVAGSLSTVKTKYFIAILEPDGTS